jgi:hypothetical protein
MALLGGWHKGDNADLGRTFQSFLLLEQHPAKMVLVVHLDLFCVQVRITKGKFASGSIVPRPEILKQRRTPLPLPGKACGHRTSVFALVELGCMRHNLYAIPVTRNLVNQAAVPLTGPKDTSVAEAVRLTYTEGDFPSAAQKHYSTAAHACGYRELMPVGLRVIQQRFCAAGYAWRGFAAFGLRLL